MRRRYWLKHSAKSVTFFSRHRMPRGAAVPGNKSQLDMEV